MRVCRAAWPPPPGSSFRDPGAAGAGRRSWLRVGAGRARTRPVGPCRWSSGAGRCCTPPAMSSPPGGLRRGWRTCCGTTARTPGWSGRTRRRRCPALIRLMIWSSGVGRLMLSAVSGCQSPELFVVAAHPGGEGLEGGAEGGDLVGEAGEGAAGGGAVAVFVDDGAEGGVAVEGGAAESGAAATAVKVTGCPSWWSWVQARSTRLRVLVLVILRASLIRVSSRAMSRWCRSASAIQPRCWASRARLGRRRVGRRGWAVSWVRCGSWGSARRCWRRRRRLGRVRAGRTRRPSGIFSSGVFFQSAPPVMSASGRLILAVVGVRACCLGQVEGAFVLGADGGVEQSPVAQAHLGGDVARAGPSAPATRPRR